MSEEERIFSLTHYEDLLAIADQLKQRILVASTLEETATLQVQTESLIQELAICVERVRAENKAKTVLRFNDSSICGLSNLSGGSPPPAVRLMQNRMQNHT